MTITKHDAVVQAIVAALATDPALIGVSVTEETSFEELPQGVDLALRVSLLDSQPLNRAYGNVDWSTVVRVACMARNDKATTTQGRTSSRLGATAYARIMSEQTLGGLADRIDEPRIAPDMNFYGTRVGVLNMDYAVKHTTAGRVIA